MRLYKPAWRAAISLLISTLTACTYPIFGFIFANIAFFFLDPLSSEFINLRNKWCGVFILYVVCIGLVTWWQKATFVSLGEDLTYTIRKNLFKSILYK